MTQLNFSKRKILNDGIVNFHDGLNVLVGGNGSGKSSLLEAVFTKYLETKEVKIIAFSSGQNQNFEEDYIRTLQRQRTFLNKGEINQLNSFYFDISWAPILLLMALFLKGTEKVKEKEMTTYKAKGLVAKFMLDKGYSLSDISFVMKVPKFYLDLVKRIEDFASSDFVSVIDTIFDIDSINEDKAQKGGVRNLV